MKIRFLAAFVVAYALCVVNTEAAVGSPLPSKLPMMGSDLAFRTWIVTNQMVSVGTYVLYTNDTGLLINGFGYLKGLTFRSESEYQSYVRSNGFRLFMSNSNSFPQTKPLHFLIDVGYYLPDLDSGGPIYVMNVHKQIGLPATVTSNSFVGNIPFQEHAYFRVPDLEAFTVEVRGLYTNSWPRIVGRHDGANLVPPAPLELTTNNYVVLNPWYSVGTNQTEVRISIKVGGKTRWYTQFGESLDSTPAIRLTGNTIECSFARGAIATIETSTNLAYWSSFTNFSDLKGVGSFSVTIPKDQPRKFFRVGIQ